MGTYRPPPQDENDAEFWQRLREMAKALERGLQVEDDGEGGGRDKSKSQQASAERGTADKLEWPARRGHKRVDEPKLQLVDLSKYVDTTG